MRARVVIHEAGHLLLQKVAYGLSAQCAYVGITPEGHIVGGLLENPGLFAAMRSSLADQGSDALVTACAVNLGGWASVKGALVRGLAAIETPRDAGNPGFEGAEDDHAKTVDMLRKCAVDEARIGAYIHQALDEAERSIAPHTAFLTGFLELMISLPENSRNCHGRRLDSCQVMEQDQIAGLFDRHGL